MSSRLVLRQRLIIAVTLAIPLLLLGAIELALRAVGYGDDYPLFVAAPDHPDYLLTNPDMARRYFAAGPFVPTPSLEFFHLRKTPTSFRIVFQGESSAQGFPYGHGGMPSRMLEQRLQASFPDRDIEVINTALTGVNSYTLLDQVSEILAQRPDAVLIYAGHNEYYGVFGVGASHGLGSRRALVQSYLAVRRFRVVQLLARLIGGLAPNAPAKEGGPRTVMQYMAAGQRVPLNSSRYQQGLEQFRANLAELLSRYHAAGVPVFIGTLVSNERDQPPLAGADSADSDSATVYYALARRLDAGGDTVRARLAYREAKERDALRFRAPEAMNRIIREEASHYNATVVETQRAFELASPGGVPGRALILEHLHPNLDGYFLIANAFYDALHARNMIGEWTNAVPAAKARAAIAVTPVDSLMAIMRTDRLVSGWPFRDRGAERTPVVDTLHPRDDVERLAQGVVLGRTSWPAATDSVRVSAERAGDDDVATRAALALAEEYRYSAEPLLDLAELSARRGRVDEALRYGRAAMARQQTARGTRLLGQLLLQTGDREGALPYLQQAAAAAPGDRRAEARYVAAGEIPMLEQRRDASPRDPTALYELALAYALTDQNEKAIAVLGTLRRVAPGHPGARQLMQHLRPGAR